MHMERAIVRDDFCRNKCEQVGEPLGERCSLEILCIKYARQSMEKVHFTTALLAEYANVFQQKLSCSTYFIVRKNLLHLKKKVIISRVKIVYYFFVIYIMLKNNENCRKRKHWSRQISS